MAPFCCGDFFRESPKFWVSIPSPKRVWRLFQLRLTRLFGTGLAEPNWWDPAQSGVPLVVFSSISWCPMNHEPMNDGWSKVSLWSVANIPTFRCFYSKWWVVEKLFPYEDLRFYLWRSPTIPGVKTPGTAFIGPHVSVLYVRSGIDDQNLTRHQTDACKGTEEGRWIECCRYYIISI